MWLCSVPWKHSCSTKQHWRTTSWQVSDLRVCFWEGDSTCLIYHACDMGPAKEACSALSVFNCSLWNCIHLSAYGTPDFGWNDGKTEVKELFSPWSWELNGTHFWKWYNCWDNSALGMVVSSGFSNFFKAHSVLSLSVESYVPWSLQLTITCYSRNTWKGQWILMVKLHL